MEQVRKNSARAWLLAARPKTLSAALIPVVTSSALAFASGPFRLLPVLGCMLFAALMQIAANFINDLFDFLKGTDGEERLGPERACAQGWISPSSMKRGIALMLVFAAVVGLATFYGSIITSPSAFVADNLLLITVYFLLVGLACLLFAFLYTTLLSYCGLGDVLVYLFFGFVPVAGTYFLLTGWLIPEVWWLSAAVGLITDTLLVLNNYRDRDTDRACGKRTLIAVLGGRFGSWFYLLQGVFGALCFSALAFYGLLSAPLVLLYLIPHFLTWREMVRINRGRELNKILGKTSRNMLFFACLAVLSLVFCIV